LIVNPTKEKLLRGQVVLGTGLGWPDISMVGAFAGAGLDFFRIEGEHGPVSHRDLAHIVWASQRAGITPTARVPGNVEHEILHYLDAGVLGITVPHVRSGEDAARAVRYAKHWPLGRRGDNYPGRRGLYGEGLSQREYYERANESTLLIALIEDIEGVEDIEAILATPGVDAIDVGPYDLAQSMGLPAQKEVDEAVDRVVRAAVEAGKPVGVGGSGDWRNPEKMRRFMDMGCRYFLTGGFFEYGAAECMRTVEGLRKSLGI
jgi:2-keto-3-deoxy-L-rhamnonate aldolase RhmA